MENKIPHLEWNGIVTALSRLVHDGWGTALVLDFGNRHRRDRGACGHLVSPTLLRQGKLGNRSSAYRLGGVQSPDRWRLHCLTNPAPSSACFNANSHRDNVSHWWRCRPDR